MNYNNPQPNLIPAEEVENCEAWLMPVLEAVGKPVSVNRKQKRRAPTECEDPFIGLMTASKAQQIQDQAYSEGLELGRQEGLLQAETEIHQVKKQFEHLIAQLTHPLQQKQQELEVALVHLSNGIAKALIKNLAQVDEQIMLTVARQAIAELPDGSDNIQLIVHPNDVELLADIATQQGESWKVIADASLVSGGCVVKSQYSFIDFTLDTRFQLMLEKLLNEQINDAAHDNSSSLETLE